MGLFTFSLSLFFPAHFVKAEVQRFLQQDCQLLFVCLKLKAGIYMCKLNLYITLHVWQDTHRRTSVNWHFRLKHLWLSIHLLEQDFFFSIQIYKIIIFIEKLSKNLSRQKIRMCFFQAKIMTFVPGVWRLWKTRMQQLYLVKINKSTWGANGLEQLDLNDINGSMRRP